MMRLRGRPLLLLRFEHSVSAQLIVSLVPKYVLLYADMVKLDDCIFYLSFE